MNNKIKNYVNVLFNDVPKTRKAAELKEEILSNLMEHFDAHVAEGKSENQAYTEALADLGDIDELLSSLAPERELKPRIDAYKERKARNTSIAVMMYIFGVIILTGFPAISAIFGLGNEDKAGIIGFILMLLCVAAATGLIVYTKMSVPTDVEPYLASKDNDNDFKNKKNPGFWQSLSKLYWLSVTIIFLLVSFSTGKWYITWIIWLIASAVWQAINLFSNNQNDDSE